MTIDEAVKSYQACKKLARLYDAYRASSRAQAMVIDRLAKGLDKHDDDYVKKIAEYRSHVALAKESDFVFSVRTEDIHKRLQALRREYPLS